MPTIFAVWDGYKLSDPSDILRMSSSDYRPLKDYSDARPTLCRLFLLSGINGVNESFVIRSSKQLEIGRQHRVSVHRLPHFVVLRLDRKWTTMSFCNEKYQSKTFPDLLTLGSVSDRNIRSLNNDQGKFHFKGCIFKVHIGKNALLFSHKRSVFNGNNMYGLVMTARDGSEESNKDIITKNICFPLKFDYRLQALRKRKQQDHLRTVVREKVEIRLVFRTIDKTFRLLTWKGTPNGEYSLQLDIRDGRLVLALQCASRRYYTTPPKMRVDDNETHTFILHKLKNQLEMHLDSTSETLTKKYCPPLLNSGTVLLLGKNVAYGNQTNDRYQRTFHGCILDFHFTNQSVDIRETLPEKFLCKPS